MSLLLGVEAMVPAKGVDVNGGRCEIGKAYRDSCRPIR